MPPASLQLDNLGAGIGLRAAHHREVLESPPAIDWLEIVTENYLHTDGYPLHVLDRLAERYPIAMHGVSLNIGGTDPLDRDYLGEVRRLQQRCRARWVSDHLCWTAVDGVQLHDLLPLPRTATVLRHLVDRVRQVQDCLERPLVLENPSTYLEFAGAELDEPAFLTELCGATGCGLLLDVNNVQVCAHNHGFDAIEYLRRVPWQHVVYFHLAGHEDLGTHCIDTHDRAVAPAVWRLHQVAWELSGGRSTLLEWDADLPPLESLVKEGRRAQLPPHRGGRQPAGSRGPRQRA